MKRVFIQATAAVLLAGCAHGTPDWPVALLGDPVPVGAAMQSIVIRPDTQWVNVTGGDVVRFDVGGKSFAWAFNVASVVSSFDLNRVAPPGVLGRPVAVYVSPDPRYIGGDGKDFEG